MDYLQFRKKHRLMANGAESRNSAKKVLVVSLSNFLAQVKTECVLAKALQLQGWSPVILTHKRCPGVKYYKVFGLDRFAFFDDYSRQRVSNSALNEAEAFLEKVTSVQAIKAYQYRGVNVGRQVLSTVTRQLHRSADLQDPQFLKLLRRLFPRAIDDIFAAEAVLDEIKPDMTLFLDKDYMGIGAVYDLSVNRGINTIQWCGSRRDDAYMLRRYTPDTRNVHPASLSSESWDWLKRMPWTAQHEHRLLREFKMRYEDGVWKSYYNKSYGKIKQKEQLLRELDLDPSKKIAVVFSHILWDSTFFWGEDLFDDYGEWLVETVRAACANPCLNWIVKLHPANSWKLKRENVDGLYDRVLLDKRIGRLPNHIKVLEPDSDVNTFSLFGITDYCLTVRGTAGIELPVFGIPVFTAGTGRYSGLGFTIDSESRADYLEKLARIQEYPRLAAEQVELAKKYAYGVFMLRPWRVQTFERRYLPLRRGGHPLDHNLVIHANSPEDLAEANDLRVFSEWAGSSNRLDFLSPGVE